MIELHWAWWLLILIGGVIVLFVLQFPIFLSFIAANLLFVFVFFGDRGFGMVANSLFDTISSTTLIAVPLFVLMGEILFKSGAMEVVYRALDVLFARMRARLYVLTITLSVIYGALCGAAVAVAAMMGRSIYPVMIDKGCDPRLSAGVIMVGASLAPIIPPSIAAVLVGSLTNISIADLLVAGILPGILIALVCLAWVIVRLRLIPDDSVRMVPQGAQASWAERGKAIASMLPFVGVIFSVMGTIMLGIATPEESAAMGVLASILVAAYYRSLSFPLIKKCLLETIRITAILLIIMASSKLFSQLLAITGATNQIAQAIAAIEASRWVIFFVMMIIPFILCMFVDQTAIMLIMIPIFSPIINILGFDPLWFWEMFLINLILGGITPPFGYVMFAFASATGEKMTEVYRAAIPMVVVFVIAMTVLTIFPDIVTVLPALGN